MKLTKKTWNPTALNVVEQDIPSLLDLSVESGSRKHILLLKVPDCTHPTSRYADDENTSFDLKSSHRPVPSLAIATLAAFFDKYKRYDYNLKAVDINMEGYTKPNEPIDISVYPQLLEKTIS